VGAITFAIRTGLGPRATYEHALKLAQARKVPDSLLKALRLAATQKPLDYLRLQGWVIIAFQNAFCQLLHAISSEEGIIQAVREGGDTDTNGAIAGALLGAVHSRESIPRQWSASILPCRPIGALCGAARPRLARYWPVDILVLAERLLLTGFSATTP